MINGDSTLYMFHFFVLDFCLHHWKCHIYRSTVSWIIFRMISSGGVIYLINNLCSNRAQGNHPSGGHHINYRIQFAYALVYWKNYQSISSTPTLLLTLIEELSLIASWKLKKPLKALTINNLSYTLKYIINTYFFLFYKLAFTIYHTTVSLF